jgi:hypothetical protein
MVRSQSWIVLSVIAVALVYSVFVLGFNKFQKQLSWCQLAPSGSAVLPLKTVQVHPENHSLQPGDPQGFRRAQAAALSRRHGYALQSATIPFEMPAAVGLPSDNWRPHVFSTCVPGMPGGFAPCLQYDNLLRSEELVYPGRSTCDDVLLTVVGGCVML